MSLHYLAKYLCSVIAMLKNRVKQTAMQDSVVEKYLAYTHLPHRRNTSRRNAFAHNQPSVSRWWC